MRNSFQLFKASLRTLTSAPYTSLLTSFLKRLRKTVRKKLEGKKIGGNPRPALFGAVCRVLLRASTPSISAALSNAADLNGDGSSFSSSVQQTPLTRPPGKDASKGRAGALFLWRKTQTSEGHF
jgi:hypothetical protein